MNGLSAMHVLERKTDVYDLSGRLIKNRQTVEGRALPVASWCCTKPGELDGCLAHPAPRYRLRAVARPNSEIGGGERYALAGAW